jgi:hypothetical protein
MGRRSAPTADGASKGRVDLPAEVTYRLDVLAAEWSYRRGRPVSRADVVVELLRPHLNVVVSIGEGPSGMDPGDG